MGANAQITVPSFTAGDVLTAAQMNQSARTGVPVFAGTTERDAAFGGTGEKTLAEGQLCYLESTDLVQYYDGSTWKNIAATGMSLVATGSFTSVTSVALPQDTFTATYRNYRVIYNLTVSTDSDITVRLRALGTDSTNATYNTTLSGILSTSGASDLAANSATSWNFGEQDASADFYSAAFDIMQPQLNTRTSAHGTLVMVNKAATATIGRAGGWWSGTSAQYDSLNLISSVASSMTGIYRVYGYID